MLTPFERNYLKIRGKRRRGGDLEGNQSITPKDPTKRLKNMKEKIMGVKRKTKLHTLQRD